MSHEKVLSVVRILKSEKIMLTDLDKHKSLWLLESAARMATSEKQSFINCNSPALIAGLERLGFRRSLIDDFKGEITVITDGVITTADRVFPKRNPEYVEFCLFKTVITESLKVKAE